MGKSIKIGFDLGNNSLKIVAIKRGKPQFHELTLPEHLVEEDTVTMPHSFSAFLKKAKKELHLPSGPAGLLLPASQVICRLVTVPKMSVDQLMLNLPYEFSDFVHGEPHQYHCDYAMCQDYLQPEEDDEVSPELTMMAAVTEKQRVQEYIQMFSAAGFSLKRILPQEMALIQLVKDYCQRHPASSGEFCFIDLGYLSTRIFIVQRDRIQTTRRIPTGCLQLDNVVADVLNVDRFLADSYKRGNHQGILEHPQCMEVYEHIGVEVLKLVNFYHFTYRQSQLEGVYLLGGGGQIQPLRQVLEETLGLPAMPLEGLLPWKEDAPKNESSFICASGLILDQEEEG